MKTKNDPNKNYAMYSSERATVQEREYKRLYLEASSQRDELLNALVMVRQALHDTDQDGFDRTAFIRTTLNDAIVTKGKK